MKLLERNVIATHQPGRAPLCGFVAYIHRDEPILLRRMGWEVGNDVHGGFEDAVSRDNGKTWSAPWNSLEIEKTKDGFIAHTENAALFHKDRGILIHFTNDKLETDLSDCDLNQNCSVRITTGDPMAVSKGTAPEPFITDFGFKQGLCVSFSHPMLDSRGRVLMPLQWQKRDDDGSIHRQGFPVRESLKDILRDVWDVGLLIGEFREDGKVSWRVGEPVPCAFEKSSRGMCEGTVAELGDGRLVMILRGSNAAWPEKPGYKWLSFSKDGGMTWSEAVPLPCDDGSVIESSATGSTLFRSEKTGKLYWIGNLCAEGERPRGNDPRSPLVIAEMQEEPFAIKRKTITVVDTRHPGEDPRVQHSNFKFYQDRVTGDVVIHLTRYGERGYENRRWEQADHYQYRVALEE